MTLLIVAPRHQLHSEDVGSNAMVDDISLSSVSERIRGALVGLAIGDALGAPAEFKSRGSFPEIREMLAGGYFRLPAGAWTDDTAMALCLADSLLANSDLDAKDLLDRFIRWMDENENTSTGRCIGIGQNTFFTLGNYRRTGAITAPSVKGRSDGNGSLMRVAPVACRHWENRAKACSLARAQSYTTHASEISAASCDATTSLLCDLISGRTWDEALGELNNGTWPAEISEIITGSWKEKSREAISSSGYVAHTLEAAIWSVGTTGSFEEALVVAVNLGSDADTVGAVTGQIAGALYGIRAIPNRWSSMLFKRDHINQRALDLMYSAVGTT